MTEENTKTQGNNQLAPIWNDSWPRVVDWFDGLFPPDLTWRTRAQHSMRIEEFSRDKSYVLRAEMPGINPDKDVDIAVSHGILTIQARREVANKDSHRSEFQYGEFNRSIALPSGAKSDDVKATYKDGILEVVVPMKEASNGAIHIPVVKN
jgi:HSP20 family protein